MAKSMRCKRVKRLRTIRREIVEKESFTLTREDAKSAAMEAALDAPKLPVRLPPPSPFMEVTAPTSESASVSANVIGGALGSFRGFSWRHLLRKLVVSLSDRKPVEKEDEIIVKEKAPVFRENEGMKRGEEINPSLVAGKEDSAASLIVFSSHYADSHWCLEELAKLCDLSSYA